jgi:hypothetical protein
MKVSKLRGYLWTKDEEERLRQMSAACATARDRERTASDRVFGEIQSARSWHNHRAFRRPEARDLELGLKAKGK